jgi:hypothetical protein
MKQLRYAFLALMTLALFSLNAQQVIKIRKSGTIKIVGGNSTPGGGGGGGGGGANLALQGFGADASGADPGDPTITVNTLSAGTGTGSLYWAINTATGGTGNSTSHKKIVFSVNGTISGGFFVDNLNHTTIDGTGHDITITANDDGMSFEGPNANHVIVKNLHFANCTGDGANVVDNGVSSGHDIAFMNCTFDGNGDGNIDVAAGSTKVTVQYCIIGKLTSTADGQASGGMLITGTEISAHHNLFDVKSAHEGERCPLIHGNYSNAFADVRYNLVYNFGRGNSTGSGFGTGVGYGTGFGECTSCYARANIANNYYYTPSTDAASDGIVVNINVGGAECYVSGNVSGNGYNFNTQSNHAEWSIASTYQIQSETTCEAVTNVLAHVGPDTKNARDNAIIAEITQLGSCAFNNIVVPQYPSWLPKGVTMVEKPFDYGYEAVLPADIINRRKKKNKPLV